jgi:hypothetical protein
MDLELWWIAETSDAEQKLCFCQVCQNKQARFEKHDPFIGQAPRDRRLSSLGLPTEQSYYLLRIQEAPQH